MRWRIHLIKALDIVLNDTILDIATGTADVPILVANQSKELWILQDPSEGKMTPILGLDPSQEMLTIGHHKIQKLHLQQYIQLIQGDVQNMSRFESESFSKISISFGLRNVENRSLALTEIFRVLKSNAPEAQSLSKFCILEFSRPTHGYLSQLALIFIKYGLPMIGTLFTRNYQAYQHLAKSIIEFPLPYELIEELHAVGFQNCQFENVFHDIVYLYTCSGQVDKNNSEDEQTKDDFEFIAQSELNLNGL